MKITIRTIKYFILLAGVILTGVQLVFAEGAGFQNNLLKVDVHRNSQGDVKVTLYTAKPYKDAILVNQKSGSEYVILMPETSNSLTAKPSLKSASDIIQNVEVKTQQASPQNAKGYTKITFSTSGPVEISAQAQSADTTGAQVNEQELKELIAQTEKKQASKIVPSQKTPPPRPTLNKNREVKIVQAPKTVSKTILKPQTQKTQTYKTASLPQPQPQALKPAAALKPVQSEVQNIPVQQEIAPEPVEVQEQAPPQTQEPAVPVQTYTAPEVAPVQMPLQPVGRLQKYKNFVKNHLIEVLAGFLIPIIVIILLLRGARNTIEKMHEQKEIFETNLEEKPLEPQDYGENISDEMNWKEKYKAFKSTGGPTPVQETEQDGEISSISDLDGLFSEDEIPEVAAQNEIQPETNEIKPQAAANDTIGLDELDKLDFGGDFFAQDSEISLDELFKDEQEEAAPVFEEQYFEEPVQAIQNEAEMISFDEPHLNETFSTVSNPIREEVLSEGEDFVVSKVDIGSNKGFCLAEVDGKTSLVGYIGDEIFIIKKFDSLVQGRLQARLSEQKGSASDYLVKINDFKAMVEVSAESMNCLIEL